MSERISIALLGLILALSAAAEEIPKPQHIPRKYTDRIDFQPVTFNQKTPDDIAKEEKATKNGLSDDLHSTGSSATRPSVFVNPQPRPMRVNNNAPPLLGDDKSKETKKSGWGWLADDVLNAKAEKKNESGESAAANNGLSGENDLFSFSSVNQMSALEKKDSGLVRDDNIERANDGRLDFSSDKNTKPIIQKSTLANISDNMDQNAWQRSGGDADQVAKSNAKENTNPFGDKPNEPDGPMLGGAFSSSGESSLNKLASGLKPAEMRGGGSMDRLQPSRDSSFTLTPISPSAVSFDRDNFSGAEPADLFNTKRDSLGSDHNFESSKSSSLSDIYQMPSLGSSLSGDSPKSTFAADPTPVSTTWSAADDTKNNNGIRTQTLPW